MVHEQLKAMDRFVLWLICDNYNSSSLYSALQQRSHEWHKRKVQLSISEWEPPQGLKDNEEGSED